MDGARIERIVVGGPAYISEQLNVGDIILEVNGRKVTSKYLHEGLFGVDVPGTKIIVKVRKEGPVQPQTREAEVVLIRMPAEQLAGRRRLFELLNKVKVVPRGPCIPCRQRQ
jgi:C-terminal processing protease CtpA/Prc